MNSDTDTNMKINDSTISLVGLGKLGCCLAGCFADFDIKDETIKKFRTMAEPGQIQFKDGTTKDISLPLSFKGFGAAFDALSKE